MTFFPKNSIGIKTPHKNDMHSPITLDHIFKMWRCGTDASTGKGRNSRSDAGFFISDGAGEARGIYSSVLKSYNEQKFKLSKPQEYENRLKELNVSDEVKDTLKKALDKFAQKKEVSIRPGKADEMLEKLTGEYHRSTGS